MSIEIHPSAIVSPQARIGENVKIGAFSIIEDDVEIGDNTEIRSSVVIANGARIGTDCKIFAHAVIATEPQDLKFKGEPTNVFVGDRTVLREYVTINRGTTSTGRTSIGADCLMMAYSHLAHDCHVGSQVVIANGSQLAGHCIVGDFVIIGGLTGVHQFCRVGDHAMIGACTKLAKDVAPYLLVDGGQAKASGINKIGLRRRGFSAELVTEIEDFYKMILHSGYNISDGIAKFLERETVSPEVSRVIDFIRSSKRGIYR